MVAPKVLMEDEMCLCCGRWLSNVEGTNKSRMPFGYKCGNIYPCIQQYTLYYVKKIKALKNILDTYRYRDRRLLTTPPIYGTLRGAPS